MHVSLHSIYIVIDYNKYKDVIAKVKKVNEINKESEFAIESNVGGAEESNKITDIAKERKIKEDKKNTKPKGGKHF